MNLIEPLIVTPQPMLNESFKGYILRLAEANGYPSVHGMLKHVGMTEYEIRSSIPNLEKLKLLVASQLNEFEFLTWQKTYSRHQLSFDQNIPKLYLHSQRPHLCPLCIMEHGYISTFSEIKYAVACPEHAVLTINQCPACGKGLSIFRPGLSICHCGYDFLKSEIQRTDNAGLLALMCIIKSKLENTLSDLVILDKAGFPTDNLTAMSLNTILSFIYRVKGRSKKHKQTDLLDAVNEAACIFTNWASGFHQYLEEVHAPEANLESSGLRKQFLPLYETLFKNGMPRQEVDFIHQAFVEFGQEKWGQALIHPRLQSHKPIIVGVYGLAKALNRQPSTIRKMVGRGIIVPHGQSEKGKLLFKITETMILEFNAEKMLIAKQAAPMLGVPESVLIAYRQLGFYKARFLPNLVKVFHEADVIELAQKLLEHVEYLPKPQNNNEKSYKYVMSKKFGTPILKAMFMEEVRVRSIIPVGKTDDHPESLIFNEQDIENLLSSLKLQLLFNAG